MRLTRTMASRFLPMIAISGVVAWSQASLPNPYRTVENWAKLPDGRTWGSTSAVDVDRTGQRFGEKIRPDELVPAAAGTEDAGLAAAVRWLSSQPRCRRAAN